MRMLQVPCCPRVLRRSSNPRCPTLSKVALVDLGAFLCFGAGPPELHLLKRFLQTCTGDSQPSVAFLFFLYDPMPTSAL